MMQIEDVTGRRRDAAARDLALAESRHRMRNLRAIAHALASQTETQGRSGEEFRDAFLGRLEALFEGQELSDDPTPDLADLIARIIKPFGPGRVRIHAGPPLALSPFKVQPMALMLHELMTNAARHGALSTPSGVVDLSWRVAGTAADGTLHLDWSEKGGPAVVRPSHTGFGSRLIEFSVKELQGDIQLRFEPPGLNATLSMPLA